jgi:hypothetical protein
MATIANGPRDLGGGYTWSPRRAQGRITFPAVLRTPDGRDVVSPRCFGGLHTARRWAEAAMRADARHGGLTTTDQYTHTHNGTTMGARLSFPIYKIEHDDFTGRLATRLSFARHATITRHHDALTGLVDADTMDGGPSGTITAPSGSAVVELQDGSLALQLPNGWVLTADEAYRVARSADQNKFYCLGWSPVDAD